MDDDLEAIVSIPWELEGESCSSNIVRAVICLMAWESGNERLSVEAEINCYMHWTKVVPPTKGNPVL